MVLRLPPQLADQVRKMLRTKQLTEEIEFEFDEGEHKNQHDFLSIMHTYINYIAQLSTHHMHARNTSSNNPHPSPSCIHVNHIHRAKKCKVQGRKEEIRCICG